MLNPSFDWLLILIDVSVKSLLLAAIVFLLLRVLKVRNSSVRHRVWAAMLCGMLALPVLSRIVPALPLPFSIDTAWLNALDEHSPAELQTEPVIASAEAVQLTDAISEPDFTANDFADQHPPGWNTMPGQGFEQRHDANVLLAAPEIREPTVPADVPIAIVAEPAHEQRAAAPTIPWYVPMLRWLPITIVALWLTGAVVMLSRLLMGLLVTRGIVRRATDVSQVLGEIPVLKSGRHGVVLESSEIRVPVTVGLLSPAILLPEEWREWSERKLDAVVTHEKTHVDRSDFTVAVLAELNRCLYWFHPLSWWLRTQLSDLAEEACDDAAIDLTGDPAGYARHLLEVATALSRGEGRVCQPGMSMARQSNVEGRITTILDLTRPLSERLTWKATLVIAALMLPAIALAAALQPASPYSDPVPDGALEQIIVDHTQKTRAGVLQSDRKKGVSDASGVEIPTVELSGRVVDPDGKPVAGAKLMLTRWDMLAPSADEKPLAVTKADGTFQVAADREECKSFASVVVLADGFGFASRPAMVLEQAGTLISELPEMHQKHVAKMMEDWGPDLKLKLDDVPLRGRILNPEGQVVPGARLKVTEVWESKDGSLDEWEKATKAPRADYYSIREKAPLSLNGPRTGRIARVEVADDGSFTIHGIGRDRIVRISLMAPGVAGAQVYARTRPGETIRLPNQWTDGDRFETYYPSEFRHVAGASQTVEGTVTDRDTGKPVAGARIIANNLAGSNLLSMDEAGFVNATTDEEGRYRLEGFPVGRNRFLVLPTLESGYVRVASSVKIAASTESLVHDIKVPRGVKLTGRVTDSNTGKGLLGHYSCYAFLNHPALNGEDRIRLADVDMQHDRTDKDGRFAMNVLPGRGLFGFMADNAGDFPRGAGAESIQDDASPNFGSSKVFRAAPNFMMSANHNVVAEFNGTINAPPKLELQLHSGMSFDVKVVDSNGAELKDYLFYGARKTSGWYPAKLDNGKVIGHQKNATRRLFAWNPKTNEAGTLLIAGDPPKNPAIRLQPAGTITGRLVDNDGEPIAGAAIRSSARVNGFFDQPTEATDLGSFPDDADTRREHLVTDADGRFKIRGVLPGLKYTAAVSRAADGSSPNGMATYLGDLFRDVVIEGAETKDLGDVKAQHDHPTGSVSKTNDKTRIATGNSRKQADLKISGVVTADRPLPANLTINVRKVFERLAYAMPETSELLMQIPVSKSGRFEATLPADKLPAKHSTREWLTLEVKADGFGFTMVEIPDAVAAANVKLKLPEAQPVSGRILNLEGLPVAGARLQVLRVSANESQSMDAWIEANRRNGGRQETPGMMYQVGSMFPATYLEQKTGPKLKATNFRIPIETFPVVQTDANGRFELTGIGKDQMIFVSLSGPGIAKDVVAVIARDMKTLRADGWYMNGLSLGNGSTFYGAKFDHVSAQSSPVKGVVRDIKTKKPVTGALVTVTTTAGKGVSRNAWLTATTDEQGRYEIRGLPTAIEKAASPNRLTVIAHGSPYLKTVFDVPSSRSPEAIEFNPELHRAVLATGVLTNLKTGKPIQGSFYYSPFINNDANARYPQYSDDVTRYEGQDPHFHTDKDGRFAFPVIPGRGLIGVICDQNIYRVSFGKNDIPELKDHKPRQGSPTSDIIQPLDMHVLRAIDVPDSEEHFEVDLQADPGHQVDIRFVDADGTPVTERLSVLGVAARGTGYAQTSDGTVTAYGLEPNTPRVLYVSNEDKSLAALAELTAERSTATIKLAPLTEVTGLLAGVKGKPLKQRYITANTSNWQMMDVVKPVKTDDEGHFILQVPVGGPYRLMTESKGRVPLRVKSGLMVAGKTLDVGTVKLSGPKKPAASTTSTGSEVRETEG